MNFTSVGWDSRYTKHDAINNDPLETQTQSTRGWPAPAQLSSNTQCPCPMWLCLGSSWGWHARAIQKCPTKFKLTLPNNLMFQALLLPAGSESPASSKCGYPNMSPSKRPADDLDVLSKPGCKGHVSQVLGHSTWRWQNSFLAGLWIGSFINYVQIYWASGVWFSTCCIQ